ncbi:hypothetical protein ACH5RR_034964 [Cinchona calisaya]|uniref:Sialate O-acetylesterase domain-containing protein n=1 Tax=Cinchona calisaya TaxID=153742 RepID=A0ABD2YCG2_9GENT
MAGRGGVDKRIWDGLIPQECYPNPAILRLNAGLTWEDAYEPLHVDIDTNKTCGVGPGLAFANTILQKGSNFEVIGLVPCAVGGTSISEWSRGSFLYNNLINRADVAIKDGGIIQAILWYQGERDTIHQEVADSYKFKLEQFIKDLRYDLQLPKLSFIQVGLASAEGSFIDEVREAQLGMDLPNVISVDAYGLPLQQDGLHLSTVAQGTERVNDEGVTEIKVDTVDYRSPPGQVQQTVKENVEVIHVKHPDDESGIGGGVVAGAAAKVAEKIQSAKETISGKSEGPNN